MAREFLFDHHNWVKAHYSLAEYYVSSGRWQEARHEYLAIHDYYPERPEPVLKIAGVFDREQNWALAEKYYQTALPLSVNKGMIYYALALAQWKQIKNARRRSEYANGHCGAGNEHRTKNHGEIQSGGIFY